MTLGWWGMILTFALWLLFAKHKLLKLFSKFCILLPRFGIKIVSFSWELVWRFGAICWVVLNWSVQQVFILYKVWLFLKTKFLHTDNSSQKFWSRWLLKNYFDKSISEASKFFLKPAANTSKLKLFLRKTQKIPEIVKRKTWIEK